MPFMTSSINATVSRQASRRSTLSGQCRFYVISKGRASSVRQRHSVLDSRSEKKRPEWAAFPLGMNFTQALSTIFLTASLALPTAS